MSNRDQTLVERRDNVAIYRDGPGAYAAIRRVSWGAIFAGAVTALATLTLLNLLGLAIGFAEINPTEEANALGGLGTGSAIWLAVSSLVALFAGGWVAGRLAGFPKKSTSMIHGVLTWAVFSIFSFYLASSAVGSIFNAVGNTLSRTASLAADGVQAVAQPAGEATQNAAADFDLTLEDVRREAAAMLEDTGDPALDPDRLERRADRAVAQAGDVARTAVRNPGAADAVVTEYINSLADRASDIAASVDKDDVAAVIAERRNMSQARAEEIVEAWDSRLSRAAANVDQSAESAVATVQERAPEIAENVANALAKTALFAFIGLLLGAIAAAFGGVAGRQLDAALLGDEALAARDVNG